MAPFSPFTTTTHAMRLCYTDMAAEAQSIAEKAVTAGVIEKNDDNALFHVAENRSALCFNDWKDYRVGADIILLHEWLCRPTSG